MVKSLAEKANAAFNSVYPEKISQDAHNLLSLVRRQRQWGLLSDNETICRLLCEEVDRHIKQSHELEKLALEG